MAYRVYFKFVSSTNTVTKGTLSYCIPGKRSCDAKITFSDIAWLKDLVSLDITTMVAKGDSMFMKTMQFGKGQMFICMRFYIIHDLEHSGICMSL